MKIKVSAGIIGAVLMLSASQSWAVTLKLSHNQDKSHPVHKAMEFFAKKSKEYSNGDITIRIYPNGTLGTRTRNNGADSFWRYSPGKNQCGRNGGADLKIPINYLACLICSAIVIILSGHAGRYGEKILNSTKSKGYFGLTFYDGGARSFYGNKPVLKPDDLKGMKVRVQPSPGAVEMIKVMGGNPTPLDYGELYTALQQGVVDMAENSVMALTTMRHGEVAKSFSLDEHTMVPDVVLMSNAAFDKLSQENQKAKRRPMVGVFTSR
ncbi:TRAP transporter substrate-binding protein DctP [Escherichia coli]|uniref:TRAP transporter substrate-binding protein DctP n=1 Tax=Escherichia coli TaxID=562 RepID=UPI0037DD2A51